SGVNRPPTPDPWPLPVVLRPHAAVEIVGAVHQGHWRCTRCQAILGPAHESYKRHALLRVADLRHSEDVPFPGKDGFLAKHLEFICPSCGALLQVETYYPGFGDELVLNDLELT
ncbi:MAG: hypothetical protein HY690_02740, partial [Chloroflexi bacterium]|nr:hypothetical protein [Chloroflexota bacterium]